MMSLRENWVYVVQSACSVKNKVLYQETRQNNLLYHLLSYTKLADLGRVKTFAMVAYFHISDFFI